MVWFWFENTETSLQNIQYIGYEFSFITKLVANNFSNDGLTHKSSNRVYKKHAFILVSKYKLCMEK